MKIEHCPKCATSGILYEDRTIQATIVELADAGLRIVFGLALFVVVLIYIVSELVSWKRGK